jgi:hypothetical protein
MVITQHISNNKRNPNRNKFIDEEAAIGNIIVRNQPIEENNFFQ